MPSQSCKLVSQVNDSDVTCRVSLDREEWVILVIGIGHCYRYRSSDIKGSGGACTQNPKRELKEQKGDELRD